MGSQNEATPDTGKPNARAGHGDVVKGVEDRKKGTVMRNWQYEGWSDRDWNSLADDSAALNALAREFDNAIGGGGGGFTPAELAEFQNRLAAMVGRIERIRNSYY